MRTVCEISWAGICPIDRGWRTHGAGPSATTIVDLSGGGNSWMILREGAIPTHEIALALQH